MFIKLVLAYGKGEISNGCQPSKGANQISNTSISSSAEWQHIIKLYMCRCFNQAAAVALNFTCMFGPMSKYLQHDGTLILSIQITTSAMKMTICNGSIELNFLC